MSTRAVQLANRIEEGAAQLSAFAASLTDEQWQTAVYPDGRSVGVLVHHVANMYPIEMDVIRAAAAGNAITDVTWEAVATINAQHARDYAAVTKAEAIELLARNSREAANEVRTMSDAQLDVAVPFSLSYGAPMTVQFIIEDHPLRHPWHHLARMRRAVGVSPADVLSVAA